MGIEDAILSFDGKHVANLKAISSKAFETKALDNIIDFCENDKPLLQVAATWLIKAHLEKGGGLSLKQIDRLVAQIPELSH